jgi:hypothetical protein
VFTYVYSRYALCILLQILLVAAVDIKTRNVPSVSPVNSLLSQYCKASHFLPIFMYGGGGTVRFAPVVPWTKAGPDCHSRAVSINLTAKIIAQRVFTCEISLCYSVSQYTTFGSLHSLE